MAGYKKLRTPIITPRTQGGTFYTFSSALEDIGLNINESKNKIALSHYVLLDIPKFEVKDSYGAEESNLNQGDYYFAHMLQNYALNMETVVRNKESYNFAESLTVSERVFWKFMKHEGFMDFVEDSSGNNYYVDKNEVVKGFGPITAGAQRTDSYGIYNETYVQIPSSYGQMKVLFKPVLDKNYHITNEQDEESKFVISDTENNYIENVDSSEHEDGLLHTGIPATAICDNNDSYIVSDETESLCIELSLDELNNYYGTEIPMSYDDMGIECVGIDKSNIANQPTSYTFNAILVYYSIYDSTGINILATNAYGILLINSAVMCEDGESFYKFPSLEKRQTTPTMAGSSYAFRLNIKTSSVYSGNVIVNDESTAAYEMSTEFNDVIRNLSSAIDILKSNANVIHLISSDNNKIKKLSTEALDKLSDIEQDIATLKKGTYRSMSIDSLTSKNVSVDMISAKDKEIIIEIDNDELIPSHVENDEQTQEIETLREGLKIKLSSDGANINKLVSKEATIVNIDSDNLSVNKVFAVSKDITFGGSIGDVNKEYGLINSNGVYSAADFYFKNSETQNGKDAVDESEVLTFFDNTDVYIDSSLSYHLVLPERLGAGNQGIQNLIQSIYDTPAKENEEISEDEEEQSDQEVDTPALDIVIDKAGYYNLTNLVMLLIAEVKSLHKKVSDLENN